MSKGETTRAAIVDEGLRQASRIGLEGLSLGPLATKLELTKSGLFAHFKSKEALQLNILEEAIGRFKREVIAAGTRREAPDRRLRSLFERYLVWIRGEQDDGGCLFMTAAQEFDDRPGLVRDRLVASQLDWREFLGSIISEGVASGAFREDVDPQQAVFEILGAALAYQHATKLLGDPRAKARAQAAFARVLADLKRG
ncbi:TetR/AcrR family transcriptional regulator [Bosea sp. CCNWLW174]|uniref:TetR/AcrR family transcriptional regulator n=1 Tax=unclassified Bosea (in: a-proteobacteria) TaxID=2653178 RepID=UPI0030155F56